jgi:hypothetical protein
LAGKCCARFINESLVDRHWSIADSGTEQQPETGWPGTNMWNFAEASVLRDRRDSKRI